MSPQDAFNNTILRTRNKAILLRLAEEKAQTKQLQHQISILKEDKEKYQDFLGLVKKKWNQFDSDLELLLPRAKPYSTTEINELSRSSSFLKLVLENSQNQSEDQLLENELEKCLEAKFENSKNTLQKVLTLFEEEKKSRFEIIENWKQYSEGNFSILNFDFPSFLSRCLFHFLIFR